MQWTFADLLQASHTALSLYLDSCQAVGVLEYALPYYFGWLVASECRGELKTDLSLRHVTHKTSMLPGACLVLLQELCIRL